MRNIRALKAVVTDISGVSIFLRWKPTDAANEILVRYKGFVTYS